MRENAMYFTENQKRIIEKICKSGKYSLTQFFEDDYTNRNINQYESYVISDDMLETFNSNLNDYIIVVTILEVENLIVVTKGNIKQNIPEVSIKDSEYKEISYSFLYEYNHTTIFSTGSLAKFIENNYKTEYEIEKENEEKYRRRTLYATITIAIFSMILSITIGIINIITASKREVIIKQSEQPIPVIIKQHENK